MLSSLGRELVIAAWQHRRRPGLSPANLPALRTALSEVDGRLALSDVALATDLQSETLLPRRDAALIASFLAATGLLLAVLVLLAAPCAARRSLRIDPARVLRAD